MCAATISICRLARQEWPLSTRGRFRSHRRDGPTAEQMTSRAAERRPAVLCRPPPEHERKVVCGHLLDEGLRKTVDLGQRSDRFEVSHAPV